MTPKGRVHAADTTVDQQGTTWKTACDPFTKFTVVEVDEVDEDISCKTCRRVLDDMDRKRGW